MACGQKERVKEVWFAGQYLDISFFRSRRLYQLIGDHCDVGGGGHIYDDEITARPSQIPLVWMMREAHHAGLLYQYDSSVFWISRPQRTDREIEIVSKLSRIPLSSRSILRLELR